MAGTTTGQQEQASLLGNVFSVVRAADLLGGVPPSTVRGWVLSGRLTAIRVGRRWMVTRDSLERLLREGR